MAVSDRTFAKFTFFKLDPAWRRREPEQRAQDKREFLAACEDFAQDRSVRAYSTVGTRGDVDLVLDFACREAVARHLPLNVVHAWQCRPVHAAAEMPYEPETVRACAEQRMTRVLGPWRSRYPDLLIEVSAAEGPARQELLEAAVDATLVVVGAPGTRCGSMTLFMLDHAPCSVAIVRTRKADP